MPKLLAHLIVAVMVVLVCRMLGAPRWLLVGAIFAGAILVHLAWEKLFANPFLYLGVRPVASDDPVMLEAKRKARESMPRLRELFPAHAKNTIVRFRLEPPGGEPEQVWGDLLELSEARAKVFLRTPTPNQTAIG